jgi:hypothetical protein
MRIKLLPALIMLVAGAVVCILDIVNKVEIKKSLTKMLLVMVIFYIIGLIARAIINKVMSVKTDKTQEGEAQEENGTGESGNEALGEVKATPAEVNKG